MTRTGLKKKKKKEKKKRLGPNQIKGSLVGSPNQNLKKTKS